VPGRGLDRGRFGPRTDAFAQPFGEQRADVGKPGQDFFRGFGQTRAVADQAMAAARERVMDRAGQREHLAALLGGEPRRYQRAGFQACFDDERAETQAGDDPVATREKFRLARRAGRKLRDQRAMFENAFEQLPVPIPQWRDLLEILIVAFVIYRMLRFLVGTRALQIVFGLLVLAAIYLAAFLLKLSMITYILGVVFTYGALAALVVFQPELRQALARLGQTRVFRIFGAPGVPLTATEIAEAVVWLCLDAPVYMTAERLNMSGGMDRD